MPPSRTILRERYPTPEEKVSFATRGKVSRTTQLFINFGDNSRLDAMGFTPVDEVIEAMDVVDKLYAD